MRILLVNPNTTASMTERAAAAARAVVRPGTDVVAATSGEGPASIQGYLDGAECLRGLLAEVRRHDDADAVVVACFDDTGVDAVRCLAAGPVIGIGEAACHAAAVVATRFSVVTTLSRSVPVIEANIARYGFAARCGRVRATDIPVLKLEDGDPESLERIRGEIRRALDEDRAEAIVLGCAGMTDLAARLGEEFGVPVIDGVVAAVKLMEAFVEAGIATSKAGAYAAAS